MARQRARFSALAVCILTMVLATALHAQLDVDRLEVFVGSAREQASTFTVRNSTASPVTARLLVNDWDRARDGTNRFSDPGTVAGACSDVVTVFPATASLGPGESQVIRVTYEGTPRPVMCWSSVVVASTARPSERTEGATIAVEIRSAVKVYVAPTEERLEVRIEELDVGRHQPRPNQPPADTAGHDVYAVLQNAGNVHVRAKVRVEFRTSADSLVREVTDDDVPLLPGAEREWRSRLPSLPAGRYVILVVVDFGGTELVAGQIELELTP